MSLCVCDLTFVGAVTAGIKLMVNFDFFGNSVFSGRSLPLRLVASPLVLILEVQYLGVFFQVYVQYVKFQILIENPQFDKKSQLIKSQVETVN